MNVSPAGLPAAFPAQADRTLSGAAFARSLDAASSALEEADSSATALAKGNGSIVDASIARAKADVLLEVVAVGAGRVSAAVNTLMQTQV